MDRKKYLALGLCLLAALGALTGCSLKSRERYEEGHWYLGEGEYQAALAIFRSLGGYEDSGLCALYCSALLALEAGDTARARADFTNLGSFQLSPLYLRYLQAGEQEKAGQLDEAYQAYGALGSFEDARDRAQRLGELIPRRDHAAAQNLMALGRYREAYEAFVALGDYQDSESMARLCQEKYFNEAVTPIREAMARGDHAGALTALEGISFPLSPLQIAQLEQLQESCRASLYAQALAQEEKGLAGAREALALFEQLGDYQNSAPKAAALREKSSRSLALKDHDGQWQYVQLGEYPENFPILWRVVKVYENRALLLADQILDARPLCPEGESFTTYENSSLKTWLEGEFAETAFAPSVRQALWGEEPVFLLSREEAKLLPLSQDRQAGGTDFALQQGLKVSTQGMGWWWLRDQGEMSGCQSIVYFSGVVYDKGVQAQDAGAGVRPALWLDLENYPLTRGSGAREDPYRGEE